MSGPMDRLVGGVGSVCIAPALQAGEQAADALQAWAAGVAVALQLLARDLDGPRHQPQQPACPLTLHFLTQLGVLGVPRRPVQVPHSSSSNGCRSPRSDGPSQFGSDDS